MNKDVLSITWKSDRRVRVAKKIHENLSWGGAKSVKILSNKYCLLYRLLPKYKILPFTTKKYFFWHIELHSNEKTPCNFWTNFGLSGHSGSHTHRCLRLLSFFLSSDDHITLGPFHLCTVAEIFLDKDDIEKAKPKLFVNIICICETSRRFSKLSFSKCLFQR